MKMEFLLEEKNWTSALQYAERVYSNVEFPVGKHTSYVVGKARTGKQQNVSVAYPVFAGRELCFSPEAYHCIDECRFS